MAEESGPTDSASLPRSQAANLEAARRGRRNSREPWLNFTTRVAAFVSRNTNRVICKSTITSLSKSPAIRQEIRTPLNSCSFAVPAIGRSRGRASTARIWTTDQLLKVCQSCYWAAPEHYAHVALRLVRRLDVVWSGDRVPEYERLVRLSQHARKKLPEFVKDVLRDAIDENPA